MRHQTRTERLAVPKHELGRVTIAEAVDDDYRYIDALQAKLCNNVGFVPKTAIRNHLERRSYDLLTINGQPVGYSMAAGGIRKPFRLIQVAIQPDAWRTGLGTLLIRLALAKAATKPRNTMTATVRQGLPMNTVVTQTGAVLQSVNNSPKARKRPLHNYTWHDSQTETAQLLLLRDPQQPHANLTPSDSDSHTLGPSGLWTAPLVLTLPGHERHDNPTPRPSGTSNDPFHAWMCPRSK